MALNYELKERLHRLASKFEEQVTEHEGWGQFLDIPKRHVQTGIYGTSAGLIVLAMAGRGPDAAAMRAARQLRAWWEQRDAAEYSRRRFTQTLRLAFMSLSLRLAGLPEFQATRKEIEGELVRRVLPSGMWGNYWISGDEHDETPRVFASAITVLSLTLDRNADDPPDPRVLEASERLEEKLRGDRQLAPHEVTAASTAVMAARGKDLDPKTQRTISRMARVAAPGLGDQGVYFSDYEHEPIEGSRYGRDYYIVPTRVLLAIGGFQPGAPSSLRLLAEATVKSVSKNLQEHAGAYCSEEGARLSTVDQAWAAILLGSAAKGDTLPDPLQRLWYHLVRVRQGGWLMETGIPVTSIVSVFVLSAVIASLNRRVSDPSLVADVVGPLANLVVGGLYGPRYLGRLLPGRG